MACRASTSASSDPDKGSKDKNKTRGSNLSSKNPRKEVSPSRGSKAASSDEQHRHRALDKLYERAASRERARTVSPAMPPEGPQLQVPRAPEVGASHLDSIVPSSNAEIWGSVSEHTL